ncbi:MAG: hypothetical protein WAL29_15190 [Bacteroidales bacterium]
MKCIFGTRYNFLKIFRCSCLLLILMAMSLPEARGQQIRKDVPPLKDRLFYGGSLGLQFGTFTDIEISPVIGLWVLPRIGVAVGPNFRYYKDPYDRTTIYGGRAYIQYLFLQDINNLIPLGLHLGLFLHGEDEALSLESSFFRDPNSTGRFVLNTFLAGGGVRQPLGQRSSLNFIFLWALNNSEYSVYGNPEIRISIIF